MIESEDLGSVSKAVRLFGQEGLRIVSLIVGFSVVQLVLMVAAFRSKRQNINDLIAFILMFVGVLGVMSLVLAPILSRAGSIGNNVMALVGVVMTVGVLAAGMMFKEGVLRFTTGTVAMAHGDDVSQGVLTRLKAVARVNAVKGALGDTDFSDSRTRYFVGFHSDAEFVAALPQLSQRPDAVFFSLGSTGESVVHPANSFRLMASNKRQWDAARCAMGNVPITLVTTPALKRWASDFEGAASVLVLGETPDDQIVAALGKAGGVFVHVETADLTQLTEKVPAEGVKATVRLSQTAAFDTLPAPVWAWVRSTNTSVSAVHTSALAPYTCARDVLSKEAAELCRELVMGGLEDLRSPFEVNAFIHSVPTLRFTRDGDMEKGKAHMSFAKANATQDLWEMVPIMPKCKVDGVND